MRSSTRNPAAWGADRASRLTFADQNEHAGYSSQAPAKQVESRSFKITNAKRIDKNTLVGKFDLEMPSGLKISGMMLFEKDGKRWVNFPSREWVGDDGAKQYSPFLEFASKEARGRFQTAVLPLAEEAILR